jgi:major membrane immunogen (membrane-anchored lipoprotein)
MIRTLLAAALILTGCAPSDQLDQIMGRTDGTPTTSTQSIDCDLIFPAPSKDTLAP